MKKIQFAALACVILSAAFLPSALANHRTGSIIAPELIVAGDFNQDGKMDLAVNCTGFDVVAILFGDGHGGITFGGIFRSVPSQRSFRWRMCIGLDMSTA